MAELESADDDPSKFSQQDSNEAKSAIYLPMKKHKSFATKNISKGSSSIPTKDSPYTQVRVDEEEEEKKFIQNRRYQVQVLMDHGVTQDKGYKL